MNTRWELFKQKLKTPKGRKILALVIILIIALSFGGWAIYNRYFKKNIQEQQAENVKIDVNKTPVEEKIASKLDGVKYAKDIANRHPIAIMVENHPEARPQVGLDKASVVYETEAEGGITRFMPIFGPKDAEMVGPVRSARSPFLDWALEYDAFYAHCGGSADALALIPQIGIKDMNQFAIGTQAFWREAENKALEHTLYTDTTQLRDVAKANGWDVSTSDFTPLEFKKDIAEDKRALSQSVFVNFSSALYNVQWDYIPKSNDYVRIMAGIAHNDRITGEQLRAKNIVIQEVSRTLITNTGGKQVWSLDTVGSGNAYVIQDGKKIDATWSKSSRNDRTVLTDPNGEEIKMNPGVIWYEILPSLNDISFE